jgi:hypothetical protein
LQLGANLSLKWLHCAKKKNKFERLEKIKYSNPQLIVREWTVKNVTVKMPYSLGSFNW